MIRQRGFALLMVLWAVGLLALLVAQFTSTGRTETRVAANLRANAVAEAAADGALHEAILRLLKGAWLPDDRPRAIRVQGAVVQVKIQNQVSKINPNTVPQARMQQLLTRLGVDPGKAAALAHAIIDWRSSGLKSTSGGSKISQYQSAGLPYAPPGRPFDSVDEVGQVFGMTPSIFARVRPFLSVYQEGDESGAEESGSAPGDVSSTVDREGWSLGSTGRIMVVAIQAAAVGEKGGRFKRQAVVRLRAEPSLDQAPYQILTWEMLQD